MLTVIVNVICWLPVVDTTQQQVVKCIHMCGRVVFIGLKLCFSIREVAQSHHSLEQELAHAVNASSKAMDVVYANSKNSGVINTY